MSYSIHNANTALVHFTGWHVFRLLTPVERLHTNKELTFNHDFVALEGTELHK